MTLIVSHCQSAREPFTEPVEDVDVYEWPETGSAWHWQDSGFAAGVFLGVFFRHPLPRT